MDVKNQINSFLRDKPCASLEIPDCEELKTAYKAQLSKGGKGCSRCRKNAIMRKFKKIISKRLSNAE
tara:strand:- start:196 stop:396 length:201 start_codon:yes stop_codon:yes gene_type:complete